MKHVSTYNEVGSATLQDVLDRIAANPDIADTRKRDLRSAIISFGKLADKAPASIVLDLNQLRRVLDDADGTIARVSANAERISAATSLPRSTHPACTLCSKQARSNLMQPGKRSSSLSMIHASGTAFPGLRDGAA